MMPQDQYDAKIKAFLVVVITLGFFGVIVGLFNVTNLDDKVKDILLVLLGALLASYKEITGYFFGSSSGSARKDDMIATANANNQTNSQAPILTVSPTVAVAPEAAVTITPPKETP